MATALYTHHHYGWRKHELPGSDEADLVAALHATHDFLVKYAGRYRVEIKRTGDTSYDGRVEVYWDSDKPLFFVTRSSLLRGEHWFSGFQFNVADEAACRYCGGTGIDHYSPLSHCWACDGAAVQVRQSMPRGFMRKPTAFCAKVTHDKYAAYLAGLQSAAA